MDKRGKPKKVIDPVAYDLLKSIVTEQREVTDEDIINFMMIPLCLETVRYLEDGIVDSAAEADMGLIYGIGFPPFRGGTLRYIDTVGVAEFLPWPTNMPSWARCTPRLPSFAKWPLRARSFSVNRGQTRARVNL